MDYENEQAKTKLILRSLDETLSLKGSKTQVQVLYDKIEKEYSTKAENEDFMEKIEAANHFLAGRIDE